MSETPDQKVEERDCEAADPIVGRLVCAHKEAASLIHREIAEAVAKAREEGRREGLQWQPIETAPNNRTVLVTNGKTVNIARRINIGNQRREEPLLVWYACLDEEIVEPSDISGQSAMLDNTRRDDPPTRWMPLPPLPQ